MIRFGLIASLCLTLAAPALAQTTKNPAGAPNAEVVLPESGEQPVLDPKAVPPPDLSLGAPISPNRLPSTLDQSFDQKIDADAASPVGSPRLPSPVDTGGVARRIDEGLTAAGEVSKFPPDYAFGAFQRGYFLTAFSLALDRAKAGDAAARTLLGELLSRGLGVKQDLKAAADWYKLAADGGDSEAIYALGRMSLEGAGIAKDAAKAADLFEQAAKTGHAVAAREFAYLLLQGEGREKNAMLAAAWLRRAAGLGDMDAQYALAGLFVEGVGVVADEKQAARWYGAAARNGHVGAQIEYAIMLFNGDGVAKNEAVAARWFGEAAAADNPVAQIRLARLLAEGRGLDQDAAAAARWYLIARERGVRDAFLDNWLHDLDAKTRDEAQKAADRWKGARLDLQASAAPAAPPEPVDKSVQ